MGHKLEYHNDKQAPPHQPEATAFNFAQGLFLHFVQLVLFAENILWPLKQQAEKLEAKFQRLNEQQLALAVKLEDSTIYQDSNKDKLKKLLAEKAKVDSELADVEVAYLQALEAYEIAGGQ